ncbi:MAG: hypothetical protein K1Y36_21950 [Blastocatellia bacterium]|nr:hypothetical protein [Blastocatellia bacterium]
MPDKTVFSFPHSWLLALSLLCFFPGSGVALPLADRKKPQVVANYLKGTEAETPEKISPVETKTVLALMADKPKNTYQTEPSVEEKKTGSFTTAGVQETAFLIRGTDPEPIGDIGLANDGRLIVVAGKQVVVDYLFNGNHILKTTDLNQDGIREFWLEGGWTHMGESAATLKIMQFKGGKPEVIWDFEQVESLQQCRPDNPDLHPVSLTSILYQLAESKNGWPTFRMDIYQGPCEAESGRRNVKRFRFLRSGKIENE